MSTQADIKSIDTLAFVKAGLVTFAHESAQAVSEVEIQAARIVSWICEEQAAYWKQEIRKASDGVNQAMKDLQHCRTYKKVGDKEPACTEEKKALEKAKRRLARAEEKADAVRRWTPIVQREYQEAGVRLTRFREVLDVDCPKAVARLERMIRAIDHYVHTAAPRAEGPAHATGASPSMARPAEESPPAVEPTVAKQDETTP